MSQAEGTEPTSYVYLSNKDLEGKYRMALSKLQNAYDDVKYLHDGGFGEQLDVVLVEMDRSIGWLTYERDAAAEKYGFTIKAGIGPGDTETKSDDQLPAT